MLLSRNQTEVLSDLYTKTFSTRSLRRLCGLSVGSFRATADLTARPDYLGEMPSRCSGRKVGWEGV